jgi:lysine-N-methylase
VPIDQATYERYQGLPAGPLQSLIKASVFLTPEGGKPALFARIQMKEDNRCPLLSEEKLCRVQTELGEQMLSYTCKVYPRYVSKIGDFEETALTLSCPEAARLVLLSQDLFDDPTSFGPSRVPANGAGNRPVPPYFWEIREAIIGLIRNRAYPIWQRLFLLGVLCRRLDSIVKGELRRNIAEYLNSFTATVESGALQESMETLPVDDAAQLDVVLRMAGMLLNRTDISPRFVECIDAFKAGIGNAPDATLASLTANYTTAHNRTYAPFFARHPHILENYLINNILRCQFPYGKECMLAGIEPSMTREYALLTAQFALMKGLLIGVAGFHREQFSAATVVHTVQAAAKHFEHHPEFLKRASDLLVESRMDGARGLAILLRNAAPAAPSDVRIPEFPEIQAPAPIGQRPV